MVVMSGHGGGRMLCAFAIASAVAMGAPSSSWTGGGRPARRPRRLRLRAAVGQVIGSGPEVILTPASPHRAGARRGRGAAPGASGAARA